MCKTETDIGEVQRGAKRGIETWIALKEEEGWSELNGGYAMLQGVGGIIVVAHGLGEGPRDSSEEEE